MRTSFQIALVASLSVAFCPMLPSGLAADELRFETHVRPILKAHCFQCHGEEETVEGKLDIRLVRTMLAGGESGPAIVNGKPRESLLIERITKDEMPPGKKKLTAAEKKTLAAWIEQGALTARPEPMNIAAESDWTNEERSHWAFQSVRRATLPDVRPSEQLQSPIDSFLLAKLANQDLAYARPADRHTLIRRLTFNLHGLPPTPSEVHDFVHDPAPDAFARLTDKLLASPAYGERWARHWLDIAGYADSDGYTDNDRPRPWAFRYRDYVIRALNADKPFDQFIVEQLAGDELLSSSLEALAPEDQPKLAATGFLRMAPDGTGDSGVDEKVARNEVVAETIKIVSSSLLGVSVGCAQCHNHRYDPISQVDYYRLRAVFEPALDWKNWRAPPARLVNLWSPAEKQQAAAVDAELKELETNRLKELDEIVTDIFEKEVAKLTAEEQIIARDAKAAAKDKRSPEQAQLLKDHPSLNVDRGSAYLYDGKRLDQFNKAQEKLTTAAKAKKPAEQFVACLTEPPGKTPETHLFYRGDINQPKQVIAPGDLSVLGDLGAAIAVDDPNLATSGRRLALAKHLVGGTQPLVPRVLVNRIWLHHFGRGLVATPADFGVLGERPSHPELLDWLAAEFIGRGWDLKELHRQMIGSAAYQQSSNGSAVGYQQDPDNRLLSRMSLRRLETEAIRDAILAASGSLVSNMHGPASIVNPDEVGQIIVGQATRDGNGILVAKADENSPAQFRRSIYVQVRRSMPLGMLEPFDIPTNSPNCELRAKSTVAPQALLMMNSDFVVRQSERFAERVSRNAGDDAAAQIKLAWQLAYGDEPSAANIDAALSFLTSQRQHFEKQLKNDKAALTPQQQALAVFCQALFSSNRFLYVD